MHCGPDPLDGIFTRLDFYDPSASPIESGKGRGVSPSPHIVNIAIG